MIHIRFYLSREDEIVGFNVEGHGEKTVCAAISALAINTVNSIELLADTNYECEYKNELFIDFRLTDKPDSDSRILLKALMLGVRSVAEEYPGEVEIVESGEWRVLNSQLSTLNSQLSTLNSQLIRKGVFND